MGKKLVTRFLLFMTVIWMLFYGCAQEDSAEVFYTVKYHSNRGSKVPESISVKADTILKAEQLPDLFEENCTFNGWYDEETLVKANEYKVVRNVTLEASWTKNREPSSAEDEKIEDPDSKENQGGSDTKEKANYTVMHFFQKVSGIGYVQSEVDTQSLEGTVGKETAATSLMKVGFTAKAITQKTIAANNSTIVKVYYDRNKITITFDTDNGSEIDSIFGLYGASVTSPENPEKENYVFGGWDTEIPETFETDLTIKAIWTPTELSGLTIDIKNTDLEITVSDGILTATEGYSIYKWYLNNVLQNEATNELYVPYRKGVYEVVLVAKDAKENTFVVSKNVTMSDAVLHKDFAKIKGTVITGADKYGAFFIKDRIVAIDDFYICSHEVTQQEYEEVMGLNPSAGTKAVSNPVENISWYQAIAYCNKRSIKEGLDPCYSINGNTDLINPPQTLDSDWNDVICDLTLNGYRLPTEAEWEFAARGGKVGMDKSTQDTYSGSSTVSDVAWIFSNSGSETHEVMGKQNNRTGLFDMSGNVAEWCWDVYGKVTTASEIESTGTNRVYRGGSFLDTDCKVDVRYSTVPYFAYGNIGMRLVRTSVE